MICPRCAMAGKHLSAGNEAGAKIAHEQCVAPATCPCQHSVNSLTKQGTET